MPKWIEYVLKKKPADEDMLMLEDAESKSNKRVSFSGIADWLIEKMKKNNLISGALRFKGSSSYAALPGKGAAENDYYYCTDGDGTHGPGYYAWNGSSWIWIGNNDKGIDKSLKVEGAAAEAAATGEAIASLKEDLDVLGGKYVGQKISFEDGIYINTETRKIQTQDYFSLSYPIKVLSGTSVTVITYCNSTLGTGLMDSEGNIRDVAQITTETTQALYSKTIDIPDWCSSIRISCVKSHKNDASYVVSSLFDYTQKRINENLEQINQLNKTTEKQGLMNPFAWENKSIQTQSGIKFSSNTRLCTVNFHTGLERVTCKEGYKVRIWCYKNNGSYIGAWDGKKIIKRDTELSDIIFSEIYKAGAEKFLIVILKDDGSVITQSEADSVTILFKSTIIKDQIEDSIDENQPLSMASGNLQESLLRKFTKKGTICGKYIFPKDIHSANGIYKLFTIASDILDIDVCLEKKVTSLQDSIPQDPVPVYNAGIVIKANGAEYARLTPDGWRKEIFLGEDAMSIRYKGNCNDDGNRDLRLKIDTDNITIYHKSGSNIANFTKSQYSTMKVLYEALSKSPSMAEFEILQFSSSEYHRM